VSALNPKADIEQRLSHVRFVPQADITVIAQNQSQVSLSTMSSAGVEPAQNNAHEQEVPFWPHLTALKLLAAEWAMVKGASLP